MTTQHEARYINCFELHSDLAMSSSSCFLSISEHHGRPRIFPLEHGVTVYLVAGVYYIWLI